MTTQTTAPEATACACCTETFLPEEARLAESSCGRCPACCSCLPAGDEPDEEEPTLVDDLAHGATWDGTAPVDLGHGRREYRCHDGSTFVTDPAERITLDVAQSEHVLAAMMSAALLPDRLEDAA